MYRRDLITRHRQTFHQRIRRKMLPLFLPEAPLSGKFGRKLIAFGGSHGALADRS